MIQEAYVSFETAKLLKEKGFYGECMSMYVTPKPHAGMGNPNEAKIAPHGRDSHYYDGYLYQCEAPTLQMAMKWLREVYNIHVVPMIENNGNYICYLYDTKGNNVQGWDRRLSKTSYEDAVEVALKYVLENLI